MPSIAHVEFRQHRSAAFHRLHISNNLVLRIRTGTKTIRSDDGFETVAKPGEFVYLRHGETLTIGNFVSEADIYRAEGIAIDDSIIASFLSAYPNPANAPDTWSGSMSTGFDEAYSRLVSSLNAESLPERIMIHRAHEILLWLREAGAVHRTFQDEDLSDRLRTLLESDLERAWKAPDAAHELGMSEATLRRTLNREGTSFSAQLRDARLSSALTRIQTTHQPLAEIALQCGFSSQSRLSEAFRHRFDITPGKLRTCDMQIDRIT